jgi:enoyl-CoA hydratase
VIEEDLMDIQLETVQFSVDNNVALIKLDRPDRMNTLGGTMKEDLAKAFFDLAREHTAVRAVVLTGVGERAFCAGADIKERAANKPHPADYFVRQQKTHDLFRGIETFERPVIAAINGVALGGGLELALCCDIRLAATHARLGLPEVKLGVIPAAGGTQRLPRAIGESAAKELMFTGRMIGAEEALSLGLVSRVTSSDSLLDDAMALAREIAAMPPLAVSFAKHAVNTGLQTGIDQGLNIERYAAAMLVDTEDRLEGMKAFVEKRLPVFRGR